ncbi:MAG: hypothetical protein ACI9VI_001132, partial [Candidatus Azotimanducaceae bacterium]
QVVITRPDYEDLPVSVSTTVIAASEQ